MATCKNCGKGGWLTATNADGLCKLCAPIVALDVQQSVRILEDSIRLAREGKTFGTRLSRCDLAIEHSRKLLRYEEQGIQTIDPAPSALLQEFRSYRDEVVLDEAEKAASKARDKASVAATPRTRTNALSSGLLKVKEILESLDQQERGTQLLETLKSEMHRSTLDGYLEAARKAEFKGNRKKAVDQYQEALFFIKNDDIPDSQQTAEIGEIEAKVEQLQAAE